MNRKHAHTQKKTRYLQSFAGGASEGKMTSVFWDIGRWIFDKIECDVIGVMVENLFQQTLQAIRRERSEREKLDFCIPLA